jgi:hypothetical protein
MGFSPCAHFHVREPRPLNVLPYVMFITKLHIFRRGEKASLARGKRLYPVSGLAEGKDGKRAMRVCEQCLEAAEIDKRLAARSARTARRIPEIIGRQASRPNLRGMEGAHRKGRGVASVAARRSQGSGGPVIRERPEGSFRRVAHARQRL